MRNSSNPQCQHFPLGALWQTSGLWNEAGAKTGCWEQACYDLISVIVGHYVNCTSRLQFVCHASSVLSWFMFGKQGEPQILYLCREGQLSMFFQHLFFFCFAFTLSHSHAEAAQSITVCHQENAQLGVLNIPLLLSPSIFPETYGSQIGDLADFPRVRSWVFVRDLRL